jgi:hypothetical protein
MTVAEVIYYSGVHPYTLKPVKTAKTREEKQAQNRYFFWYKAEHKDWIRNRLNKLNRPDLVDRLLGSPKKENTGKPKQSGKFSGKKRR